MAALKHEWHDWHLTIPDLVAMLNSTILHGQLVWRNVNASNCFLPHANAKAIHECGPRLMAKLKGKF